MWSAVQDGHRAHELLYLAAVRDESRQPEHCQDDVDCFLIRELRRLRMLSHLGDGLRRVVRTRPLVSVAVAGDRYSVGYSALDGFGAGHLVANQPHGHVRD